MVGLTAVILLVWLGSWAAGLQATQLLAMLLAIPYVGFTAVMAWGRVRTR